MAEPFEFDENSQTYHRASSAADRGLEMRRCLDRLRHALGGDAARAEAETMLGAAIRFILDTDGQATAEAAVLDLGRALGDRLAFTLPIEPGRAPS